MHCLSFIDILQKTTDTDPKCNAHKVYLFKNDLFLYFMSAGNDFCQSSLAHIEIIALFEKNISLKSSLTRNALRYQ